MIEISLSEIHALPKYLAETSLDTEVLALEVARLSAQEKEAAVTLAAALAKYHDEQSLITAARNSKRKELQEAIKYRNSLIPHLPRGCPAPPLATYERDPNEKGHRPILLAAYDAVDKIQAEYDALPWGADSNSKDRLTPAHQDLKRELDGLVKKLRDFEHRIAEAERTLPSHLSGLTRSTLAALMDLDLTNVGWADEPRVETNAARAGIIRGEIPLDCTCLRGQVLTHPMMIEDQEFAIRLDDGCRHNICYFPGKVDPQWLDGAVPTKHAHHRLHSMSSWSRSPISTAAQERVISAIGDLPDELYGWIMFGPPGTSKTTYAAAVILDRLTFRIADNINDRSLIYGDQFEQRSLFERLNYWHAKTPAWTRQMEAFENRDFGDDTVLEPVVTATKITRASENSFPPILWLEELDKFNPTVGRRRMLYSLIDAVYEAGGLIISTTNESPAALEKILGEPLFRRLTGKNDDPAGYIVTNFFKCLDTQKKGVRKRE